MNSLDLLTLSNDYGLLATKWSSCIILVEWLPSNDLLRVNCVIDIDITRILVDTFEIDILWQNTIILFLFDLLKRDSLSSFIIYRLPIPRHPTKKNWLSFLNKFPYNFVYSNIYYPYNLSSSLSSIFSTNNLDRHTNSSSSFSKNQPSFLCFANY